MCSWTHGLIIWMSPECLMRSSLWWRDSPQWKTWHYQQATGRALSQHPMSLWSLWRRHSSGRQCLSKLNTLEVSYQCQVTLPSHCMRRSHIIAVEHNRQVIHRKAACLKFHWTGGMSDEESVCSNHPLTAKVNVVKHHILYHSEDAVHKSSGRFCWHW